jgi:hypothetical protein
MSVFALYGGAAKRGITLTVYGPAAKIAQKMKWPGENVGRG